MLEELENQETIGAWGDATFGTAYSPMIIGARANTEMAELIRELAVAPAIPLSLRRDQPEAFARVASETADVLVLLYRLAHTCGFDLQQALNAKMRINRERVWVKDHDGTGHHTRVKG